MTRSWVSNLRAHIAASGSQVVGAGQERTEVLRVELRAGRCAEPPAAQLAEPVELVQQVTQLVFKVGDRGSGAHPQEGGIERSANAIQPRISGRRGCHRGGCRDVHVR
jgi:hypothetical protein